MSDETTQPVTQPALPPKREPMTAPQWIEKLNALIEEGKADGLNPMHLMAGLGFKQFSGYGERLLAAILDPSPEKKK